MAYGWIMHKNLLYILEIINPAKLYLKLFKYNMKIKIGIKWAYVELDIE